MAWFPRALGVATAAYGAAITARPALLLGPSGMLRGGRPEPGQTGIPIVDAGMRQLRAEGWMHNRARLITASFLTKTLYLDWRAGAEHFFALLLDGDVANNCLNWQWVAGTGTDSRPNRMLNPLRQAERYDPDGDYVRRHVPELSHVDGKVLHRPWLLAAGERRGYPPPIVDLADARTRFLAARKG